MTKKKTNIQIQLCITVYTVYNVRLFNVKMKLFSYDYLYCL